MSRSKLTTSISWESVFEDYRDVGGIFQTSEIVGRVNCCEAFCLHFRPPRMSLFLWQKDGGRDG